MQLVAKWRMPPPHSRADYSLRLGFAATLTNKEK
jgi:hypothetical protein